ncbi:hypothetical protein F2Q68_00039289 [Brassica cretica]|uniref:Uncharacterized protein n=1 Tax=Brassica cretica TaxID=69181 RepID=A0A8S9MUL0_BRACR|nr:hypothetical protein F2Q68_00039289 [Brassica cretica]
MVFAPPLQGLVVQREIKFCLRLRSEQKNIHRSTITLDHRSTPTTHLSGEGCTRRSNEELLLFSDPSYLERSIRKEKRAASIDTTSTTSIDTCDRATIDSSTRTLIDTNPRADMVATLLLHKDENEDLHDPEGHLCIAADQNIDGQGAAILEPSAATEDAKVLRQRTLGY